MLGVIESFNFLKALPLVKWKIISSENELNFEFPFWLKADISGHKTEASAVLKCKNIKEAVENFKLLKKKFPNSHIVMQEQAEGIEIILGIKEDLTFGKLLMVGFGGIQAEIVKDISFRALPVDKKEIEKMLKELKLYPMLTSRKKYALDKLITLAERISLLNIKEADFNPIILNEKEAVIVDARISN